MDLFAAPVVALQFAGRRLTLDQPRIMGIVNVTPDSFSDGGQFIDPGAAIAHALQLVDEGADLIDLGAESTRPGATAIDSAEQLRRLLPVISGLRRQNNAPISIDTSDPEVMRAAIGAGADLINDVRALRQPGALEAAATLKVPVCLMHMQGEPVSMQLAPHYEDVIGGVLRFLTDRLLACRMAGIAQSACLVDPGFGFGKTLEHNLALLGALPRFLELGAPVLVGLSRKRMIGDITGRELEQRVHGSVAAALLAVELGARIVRVHEVAATRDALRIWSALKPHRKAAPAKPDPRAAAQSLFGD